MKLLGPGPEQVKAEKTLKIKGRIRGFSFGPGKEKATIRIQIGGGIVDANTFEVVVPRWYADGTIGQKVTILITPEKVVTSGLVV